jgi:hypothetical protein
MILLHSAVLARIGDQTIDGHDVVRSIIAIARAAEDVMGGTSGALYSKVKSISQLSRY